MLRTIWRQWTPVRVILVAFTLAVWLGIGLLMLPIAKRDPGSAMFLESFFTGTSAICVTGLSTVDTPTYWTPFGHVVILALIQIGGLGVMTLATVIGMAVLRRMSLRSRLTAAAEVKSEGLEDLGGVVRSVLRVSLTIEGLVAVALALRFWLGYDYPPARAAWYGVFHAVSAFNNAGFALFSDSMMGFVGDPWICLPLMGAIVSGGLGFPVLMQLRRQFRDHLKWTMNTRIVLVMTGVLLLLGMVYITALEWTNPATLGSLSWPAKMLAGAFQSVQTRTAGFNSVDISGMHSATWLGMDALMFIGGGPAGTAGGVKVTTLAVLFFIVWTEVRGESAVNVFGKRLSRAVHRQALTVLLLAGTLVIGATIVISLLSRMILDVVLFEVISAFATVGLSTGITAQLDAGSQLVLCFLMYVGRIGPITVASALALRTRRRLYELPKERPIIG